MTYQEEISKLRDRIEDYEKILSQLIQAPYSDGIIASEEKDGMYLVKKRSGETIILPVKPQEEGIKLRLFLNTKVLISSNAIIGILPSELQEKETPPHFDFIDWGDIGGLKSQIQKIRDTVELPVTQSRLYKEYGLTPSKGIVLYGPPGCGKTMVAKAIASQLLKDAKLTNDSFIYMKGGEMLSPYVGAAEAAIKAVFDRARQNYKKTKTRSVIFIDEAEAILPRRGSRFSSDVDTTIVPTFLSEMDGFEGNATFIILATNFLGQLDEAVIRPGRIDLSVEIGRPDRNDIEDIFNIYLSNTKTNGNSKQIANDAADILVGANRNDLSGALIKNIVEKAAIIAIKREVAEPKSPKGIMITDIQNALTI